MKKQRINQKRMTRTGRICFSTACLMILASCAAKPIEQDLASGDATVEIKYLDSVTMDIVDDTRTKRRRFYEDALLNQKRDYSQETQGAVDRVSTFAAAVRANAQRDQSVLERYQADGDRQLSAIENSEEMNDELLEHNKKLIQQTNELNDTKVSAAKNQAEASAELDNVKVEAVKTLLEDYNANMDILNEEINQLQKERENKINQIKDLDAKIASNPSSADFEKLPGQRTELDTRVKAIPGEIEQISGRKNEAFTKVTTMLGGKSTEQITIGTGLLAGTSTANAVALDENRFKTFIDNTTGIEYKWESDVTKTGTGKPGWVNDKKYEMNITQHPKVTPPDKTNYISEAITDLAAAKTTMEKLADSNSATALGMIGRLKSPPVERIRNDEAVFDYLLDGYRNTQISSGAEYGGMVRRVLPFNFTFTPGSSTNSGFSARVVLRPDQQQLKEAADMIAPHLDAVNQDRTAKYQNEIRIMQREAKEILTKTLIDQDYDNNCFAIDIEKGAKPSGVEPEKFFEQQAFWNAYMISIDVIKKSLQAKLNDKENEFVDTNRAYRYDLKNIIDNLAADADSILLKKESRDRSGTIPKNRVKKSKRISVLELSGVPDAKYEYSASSSVCQLNKMMSGELSKDEKDVNNFIEKINGLAEAMTAAGLVYDLHLQANPLFFDKNKKIIEVVHDVTGYQAKIPKVTVSDIEAPFASSAAPRIVQNTSREYVVEIPDTTKMNTLLSAGVTGNEVSSSLGLTAGAELALALSSSSAFMKRIPYAVPFTGQSFSLASSVKKACTDEQEKTECAGDISERSCMCSYEGQSFGWKFYKTPSGVKQMGGIAQSFKTTVVNSAVVVSMPEWISKLEAEYELSDDGGRTWRRVGGEKIALSGASLRGAFSSDAHSSFDTWVKYNLYREVDGSVGLPELKSCYYDKDSTENIIYGSSKGYTALCGENLYGVKAVLVGGRYIDNIEKVSSSLIKVGSLGLGPDDCSSAGDCAANANSKCRVALLSDFGAHYGDKPFCLQFKFADSLEPIDLSGLVQPDPATVVGENVEITFSNVGSAAHPSITNYTIPGGKQEKCENDKISILENDLLNICLQNKQDPCFIPIYGTVKVGDQKLRGILYTINMNDDGLGLGLWQPYPKIRPGVNNMTIDGENYKVEISNVEKNRIFIPELISINGKQLPKTNLTQEGSRWKFEITKSEKSKYCSSPNSSCSISISLKYTKAGWENIGTVTLPPEPPGSSSVR